jgi:hypothetical protein
LDILVNNRLYAAKFTSLNDPMEGIFTYSQDSAAPSFIEQMIDHKAQLGICSLSEIHNSTLMWSYYAAAHQGVVFGLEVETGAADIVSISKVAYSWHNVFRGFLGSDAATEARKVLSKKLTPWRHEKEVRVFSKSSFVPVALKTAYFGCLMPEAKKLLLRQVIERLSPGVMIHEIRLKDLDRQLHQDVT